MNRLVEYLAADDGLTDRLPTLVAGISPHDDYLYAARVYYPLFRQLQTKEVIIFGVTHATVRKEIGDPQGVIITESFDAWKGPKGPVAISPLREYIRRNLDNRYLMESNPAHAKEHSLEALIPFLQVADANIRITPVMVTAMPFSRMQELAAALGTVIVAYLRERHLTLGRDLVILMSSDANHYGQDFANVRFGEDASGHEQGTEADRQLVRQFLTGEIYPKMLQQLTTHLWGQKYSDPGETLWCGRYSIPLGMLTTLEIVRQVTGRSIVGTLLRYSDTYTEGVIPLTQTGMGLTAPFSLRHWVGFFSIGYTLE